jgi:hypothetical protein
MRNKIFLWLTLLIVGFLAGFIPQHFRSQRLESELASATKQAEFCQADQQLSQLRDAATLMYLEATRKNYGTAGGYAAKFFDQAQGIANSSKDAAFVSQLREVLATRDQVTADLAKGDPAAVLEIQSVLSKVEHGTKR